jgi:hypothetical protein
LPVFFSSRCLRPFSPPDQTASHSDFEVVERVVDGEGTLEQPFPGTRTITFVLCVNKNQFGEQVGFMYEKTFMGMAWTLR